MHATHLEIDTKSKEPKLRTKKYGETRAAASKIYHVKIKQSCTKHQKYHAKITKNMKSYLHETNFVLVVSQVKKHNEIFKVLCIQSVLYHQKFYCKYDFMFFVILSWYFWCLMQLCLIFTCQIFYAAARVTQYSLVRDFGFLFSVSVSIFQVLFNRLF